MGGGSWDRTGHQVSKYLPHHLKWPKVTHHDLGKANTAVVDLHGVVNRRHTCESSTGIPGYSEARKEGKAAPTGME